MTIEEFDNTSFKAEMKAKYQDKEHDIVQVDFQEKLIGLEGEFNEEEIIWVRCENCELI